MSLDSLLIRGLCVGVLLAALAFTQIDLRKRGGETATTTDHTEVIASQSFDPQGSAAPR
jgi:hypothetical protein